MNFSAIPKASILGRVLRWPLRFIPPSAVVPILQGPLRGKKWIAGSSTHGCWFGSVEHDKQRVFERALACGDVVYDLGANVGLYSLLASALVGRSGHVYAFEPFLRNIEFLRKHMAMNEVGNCTIIEAAVSDAQGHSRFDSSLAHTNVRLSDVGEATVPTVTLDSLVEEGAILPPNVIKIDIEGAELRALNGARRTICSHRPTIFLATHGHEIHRACLEFFDIAEYAVRSLTSDPIESTAELVARPIGECGAERHRS